MKKSQNIKCNVETCKYQNYDNECCELQEIQVSYCDCPVNDVSDKQETACASFEYDEEKNDREND